MHEAHWHCNPFYGKKNFNATIRFLHVHFLVKQKSRNSLHKPPSVSSSLNKRYEYKAWEDIQCLHSIGHLLSEIVVSPWRLTLSWFPTLYKLQFYSEKSFWPSIKSKQIFLFQSSNTSLDQSYTPIIAAPQSRQIILHKVKSGFGFQMRGANGTSWNGTRCPI